MKEIKTVDAVGHVLCHDMTQIIPGVTKDARFRKGHIVQPEDIPVLLRMGKETLYVWEKQPGMLHEDEAAERLRDLCQGANMRATAPKEGKIELIAACDGLLRVDVKRLEQVNGVGELMIATRHTNTPVQAGDRLAGTRVIPLVIEEKRLREAEAICGGKPLLEIMPYRLRTCGLITTGSEVAKGLVDDAFTPAILRKLAAYGVEVTRHALPGDDMAAITQAVLDFHAAGVNMILCTGGMSVDPDDRTPGAIMAAGCEIVMYGAPVLPGAMFLLGYFADGTPVMGLPGCVMYAATTILDLMLPRVAADVRVTKADLVKLGHGVLTSAGLYREEVMLPVYRKVRCALICTGDELVECGTRPLPPGKIYSSNAAVLLSRLMELGVEVTTLLPTFSDSADALADAICEAAENADVILTTGGVSVGEKDILHETLPLLFADRIFWKVRLKPGSPVMFSLYRERPMLSLSGNPFAASATFELFARPMLARLAGCAGLCPVVTEGTLAEGFSKFGRGRRFVRGVFRNGVVTLPEGHSSGQLASSVGTNCLAEVPPSDRPLPAESRVKVWLL